MGTGRIHRKGEVKIEELLSGEKQRFSGQVGALACFIGIVRGTSKNGEQVQALKYEAAEEAERTLERIANDVQSKFKLLDLQIHHVIDELKPGDDAIYVVACGKHRQEVFQALIEAMNRVKTEPLIWKKEVTPTGARWIHEV
jgi:molybdopterin synthase catalytic subunit